MLLPLQGIAHINSITHEGKVVVVATDVGGKLWYTVRRDGFETSDQPVAPGEFAERSENWEPFAPIALPDEGDDASVVAREQAMRNLLRSIYRDGAGAVAPVQLVSGMGHLYVFRQSVADTLLVNRFVLDGITNKLVRKLEVRYTRSKKRFEPEQPAKDGGRIVFDALDFRDRDGNPFYEPTSELALISGIKDGWFSVVLLPTDELDRHRWHIFAFNSATKRIELVSIAASEEGLFDLRDGRVAGIIRRQLDLGADPTGSPAATKYDVQREVETQAGKQWLRNATRVMLAVPTSETTAVIDFAAAVDGTLAKISEQPSEFSTLQGETKAVLLAPDTLEQIRAFGTTHPAASGTITGLARSDDDLVELTLQRASGAPLAGDSQIEVGAGQKVDGTYAAHTVVVGRTLAAVDGTVSGLQISALSEPLAKGTRLAVNATGSGSIVVLSQRADVGVTALQIAAAAVNAPANALITLADSPISIGALAQEIHATDLKTLPLASGLVRALDAGTRLVVGVASRQATVVTLAADAPAAASAIQIEPATLAIPANAALSWMDAFDIDLQRAALGDWKQITQADTGLVADGMVNRITVEAGGRLRVHAVDHGLVEGDQVRISGAVDYVGTWPVQQIDQDHFQLDARWQGGIATNVRLERAKRRALTFDGDKDYIADATYRLRGGEATKGRTHELWFRTTQSRCTLLIYEYDLPPNAADAQSEDALISLSKGASNSWVSAACGRNLIHAELDLADGQWHHVAHTFGGSAQGQALYVDGNLVARGITVDIPANDYPGTLLIGESLRNEALAGFRGEIAEVRVWERIRTPEEIAAAMHDPLLGREAGLIRYWPLGAIVEGKERKVADLSPSRRDAIVHGEVYAAPITLRATVADGSTPVVEYLNDSLVAVAAGMRYEESFEFRAKDSAGNVMTGVRDLFRFRYQGKRSRSSDTWITLSDVPDKDGHVAAKTFEFKALSDGWFQATGEFRVAENAELTLMRSFGIAHVQAHRFETLEVRKHGLRAIETGISEERYEDQAGKHFPAARQGDTFREANRRYKVAAAREALLVHERDHWHRLITLAEDQSQSDAEEKRLRAELDAAKAAVAAAHNSYQDELKDPTNYWCRIRNPSYDRRMVGLRGSGTTTFGEPFLDATPPSDDHLWAIKPLAEGNYFRITTKSHAANGALLAGEERGVGLSPLTASNQQQAKWHKVMVDGRDPQRRHQIKHASGRILVAIGDDQVQVRDEIRFDDQFTDQEIREAQRWILEPTNERATDRITQAEDRKVDSERRRRDKQDALDLFVQARKTTAQNVVQWKSYLGAAERQLVDARAQMQAAVRGLLGSQNAAVAMTASVRDARALETRFAQLPFVDAASRLTIGETADGHVQLAYFDREGRMRLTRYDAAASTGNGTFEQWLPDQVRRCLEIDRNAVLTQSPAIELPKEYSIEVWFHAPLPATAWNTLVGGGEERHVIAKAGAELGILLRSEGFLGCGCDLRQLHPGWHHLAAVAHGVEQGATTTFYIDGAKVGDVMGAAVESMRRAVEADATIQDKPAEMEQRLKVLQKKTYRVDSTISTIGNVALPADQPFGRVAELRLWGLALTDEEIESNSKSELSGNEPGLLAWYRLDGDTFDHATRSRTATGVDPETSGRLCTAPIGHPGNGVVRFDSSDDALQIPLSPGPDSQASLQGSWTIELWVKPGMPRRARTDSPSGSSDWQSVLALTDGVAGLLRLDTRVAYEDKDDRGEIPIERQWRIALGHAARVQPNPYADRPEWFHVALAWDAQTSTAHLFFDGQPSTKVAPQSAWTPRRLEVRPGSFNGQIAEVRLWSSLRSAQELTAWRARRVGGHESGLIGYWPLATAQPTQEVMQNVRRMVSPNVKSAAHPATLIGASVVPDHSLPLSADGLVANEYVTYGIDFATGGKTAMLRRFLATPSNGGAALLAQKRVELLELKWIGNAQFKPTLLGYIEGAPPVPSENLTVDPSSYNGAAAVELEVAEEVRYRWSREVDSGWGLSLSAFVGAEKDFQVLGEKVGGFKAGLKGDFEFTNRFLNTTSVDASSATKTLDRVELRGSPEDAPRFPTLGRRFVPKNIGYALVVSAMADVFVTRLKRTGRMVSYTLKAVEGIPPDVNTITFLINPAYTMNGSLDGLTGSEPTSERFFAGVPQMRAQYGAVYPASYYRLYDAYDRAAAIDKVDAEHATYFANFDAHSVSEGAVSRNIDVDEQSEEAQKEKAEAEAKKLKASRSAYEKNVHGGAVFESWQRKMEDLRIKAGKRNIVNTYVWDADGGTHVESQQFASTVEHTIGSSVEFNGGVGFDGNYAKFAFKAELTAQATFHLTRTMTKALESTRALSLNVDLSGVERQSVTDFKDRPYLPGQKVKRYRFMSFYLEGDTSHFDDFFGHVVDPEWLAGNSEGARALREVDRSKKNKTWRVMHRVTYVERPVLAGFGRDTRQIAGPSFFRELGPLQESVARLEADNKAVQSKLDAVLAALAAQRK